MVVTLQVGLNVMLPDGKNITASSFVTVHVACLCTEQPLVLFDMSHVIRKPGFHKMPTKTHIRL